MGPLASGWFIPNACNLFGASTLVMVPQSRLSPEGAILTFKLGSLLGAGSDAEAHSLVLFLRHVYERGPEVLGPPILQTAEQRGEVVYKRYGCRGCHGQDGSGGIANCNAQSAEQVPSLRFVKEGYTLPELKDRIRNGVEEIPKLDSEGPVPPLRMPAFGDKLSDSQLDDLSSYLTSLFPQDEVLDW